MIEQGLVFFLKADTAIATATASGGVFPEKFPQLPQAPPAGWQAISFERNGTERVKSLTGPSGLAHSLLRCSCWAQQYGLAKTLANLVRLSQGGLTGTRAWAPGTPPNILDGYRGPMGSFTVQACFVSDDTDSYVPPTRADDLGFFLTAVEISITWQEN
jgi:hypothetical protein